MCVCVCRVFVCVYIFIIILILIGLRGPLTLRRRRGPSGLRPGMACTEHSTKCHTVTQTNKSTEKKGYTDRETRGLGRDTGVYRVREVLLVDVINSVTRKG